MIRSFLQLFKGKIVEDKPYTIPQGNRYSSITSFQIDDITIVRINHLIGWCWVNPKDALQYGDFIEFPKEDSKDLTPEMLNNLFAELVRQADETKDKLNG